MMKIVLLLSLLFAVACSKKQATTGLKYTAEEFTALAQEAGPGDKEDAIKFSDYSPGVNKVDSRSLKVQRLTFFAIAFETEDEARKEALRLNQYYARNWLFDRVEGEPLLEDYVIETFKAINPRRQVQRVPKKHDTHVETSHGEASHAETAHH